MIANLVVALIIPIHSANLSTNMPENDQAVAPSNPSQLSMVRSLVTNHVRDVRERMARAVMVAHDSNGIATQLAAQDTHELDQAFVEAIQRYQQEQRQQQLALEHAMGASEELLVPATSNNTVQFVRTAITAEQQRLIDAVRQSIDGINYEVQQTANQAAFNATARQLVSSPRIELEAIAEQMRQTTERQSLNDEPLLESINTQRMAAALPPIPRSQWPALTQAGIECSLLAEDLCVECRLRHNHRVECSQFKLTAPRLPHVLPNIGEAWHPSQLQSTDQPARSPLPVDVNSNYRTIRLPAGRCERRGTEVYVETPLETNLALVGVYAGQVLGGDGNLYYDVFYRADYQQPGAVLAMAREHWDHGSGLGSIDLLSDHRRDAALRRQARMLGDRNIANPAGEIALGNPMIGAPVELNGQVIGRLMGVDHAAGTTTVSVSMHEQRPANAIHVDFTITPQGAHERNPDEPA